MGSRAEPGCLYNNPRSTFAIPRFLFTIYIVVTDTQPLFLIDDLDHPPQYPITTHTTSNKYVHRLQFPLQNVASSSSIPLLGSPIHLPSKLMNDSPPHLAYTNPSVYDTIQCRTSGYPLTTNLVPVINVVVPTKPIIAGFTTKSLTTKPTERNKIKRSPEIFFDRKQKSQKLAKKYGKKPTPDSLLQPSRSLESNRTSTSIQSAIALMPANLTQGHPPKPHSHQPGG